MRVSVQCSVLQGDPPFEFTWMKDGDALHENSVISIKKFDDFTMNLVLKRIDSDSNGNYTCKVSNIAGIDEKSALLSVKGMFYCFLIKILNLQNSFHY